jgi:hypothetical protein
MSDLFDTTRVRDDSEHWDALAERVASNAAREWNESGFEWLAHSRVTWVAASLLLAAALLSVVSPDESSSVWSRSPEWTQALAPADDVGRAVILPDSPPAIGTLLLRARGGA